MEPNGASKVSGVDITKLVTHLNELRDQLVELSIWIKDYKASDDWEQNGQTMLEAMNVVARVAKGIEGSGSKNSSP